MPYSYLHSACRKSRTKPNVVLEYLTSNHGTEKSTAFKSLQQKCLDNDNDEGTPLDIAISEGAPEMVVRALLSICPEAAEMKNVSGELPIHRVCRRPTTLITGSKANGEFTNENLGIIQCLLRAYPEGILAQDERGLVPLHYLLLNHAATRTTDEVELLVGGHSLTPNTLPGEISKISDKNGKIALHHAVKNGASKDIIRCLIESSPESITVQDNHMNAPLHAYLKNEKLEGSLSSSIISMLLSPTVASLVDRKNRTSLHLAVIAKKIIRLKALRMIIDANRNSLLAKDSHGRTPLHIAFLEESVGMDILKLLLQDPIQSGIHHRAAMVEDNLGKLPLQFACENGISNEQELSALIEAHPMSIIATDSKGRSPLHALFINKKVAKSVSVATVLALLAGHGDFDGQCTVKMEDEYSSLPIHYAVKNGAASEVIAMLIETQPESACIPNGDGDLPIHLIFSRRNEIIEDGGEPLDFLQMLIRPVSLSREACKTSGSAGSMYPIHIACNYFLSLDIYENILRSYPKCAKMKNSEGLLPLEVFQSQKSNVKNESDASIFMTIQVEIFARNTNIDQFKRNDSLLESIVSRIQSEISNDGVLSETSIILWVWLCSYDNPDDENDNYTDTVDEIFNSIDRDLFNDLLSIKDDHGSSINDIACSKVKTLIQKHYYFVGKFIFEPVPPIHRSHDNVIVGAFLINLNDNGELSSEKSKPVVIKFMMKSDSYRREVESRSVFDDNLTDNVVHILFHFSLDGNRVDDIRFKNDIQDEKLLEPLVAQGIDLQYYRSAIVMERGMCDVEDEFNHSLFTKADTVKCLKQVGKALLTFHDHDLVHGDVTLRNIIKMSNGKYSISDFDSSYYKLTNGQRTYFGQHKISSSGCLPPSAFTILNEEEEKAFEIYWKSRATDKPTTWSSSGATYTTRSVRRGVKIRPPYTRMKASKSLDVWAFGLILYYMTTGKHLFSVDKDNNVCSADVVEQILGWDDNAAKSAIYNHVKDALAQDLLLHILAPDPTKRISSISDVMTHPFFQNITSKKTQMFIELQQQQVLKWRQEKKRLKGVLNTSENISGPQMVSRMSLENYLLFDHSTFSQTQNLYERTNIHATSIMLLPYTLAYNKGGKLTPRTKRDVELVQSFGLHILQIRFHLDVIRKISKCCVDGIKGCDEVVEMLSVKDFANLLAISDTHEFCKKFLDDHYPCRGADCTWDMSELLENAVVFAKEELRRHIDNLFSIYDESEESTLYLVDEYTCLPIIDSKSSKVYPYKVGLNDSKHVARMALPFMIMMAQLSSLKGIPGFVKLLFEAAYPHLPPSWSKICSELDLKHSLDNFVEDLKTLLNESSALYPIPSSEYDLLCEFFRNVGHENEIVGITCLRDSHAGIWVSEASAKTITNELDSPAKVLNLYQTLVLDKDMELDSLKRRVQLLEKERTMHSE